MEGNPSKPESFPRNVWVGPVLTSKLGAPPRMLLSNKSPRWMLLIAAYLAFEHPTSPGEYGLVPIGCQV